MILTAILSVLVDVLLYGACALTIVQLFSPEQRLAAAVVAGVPFLIYLGYLIKEKRYFLNQESAKRRLRIGGAVFLCTGLMLFVFQKTDLFGTYFMPLFLCWLFTELYLLQLLRHRESGVLSRSFYWISFGILGVLFLVAFLLTSPTVRHGLAQGISWTYQNILAKIMVVIFYGVAWIVSMAGRLIALLFSSKEEIVQQEKPAVQIQAEQFFKESFEEKGFPAWVKGMLALVLIAAVILVIVKVIQYLVLNREKAASASGAVFERNKISGAGASKQGGLSKNKKGNRYAIRHAYRKYLRRIRKTDLLTPAEAAALEKGTACSADLMLSDSQTEQTETDAFSRLRAYYLPARYSESIPLTNEEADGAVQAEKEIKRALE